MQSEDKLPQEVQDAFRRGLLKRLPLTFLPYTNQQLREWEYLFPYERQSVQRLLVYVAGLREDEFSSLFRDVVQLEEKMGVRHWPQYSTAEQTIENSSLLARSPYFQEWRKAVQAVFDAVDKHAPKMQVAAGKPGNKLILLIIPQPLPLDPATAWAKWQGIGRPLQLALASSSATESPARTLLGGLPQEAGGRSGGLLDAVLRRPEAALADTWICEAGSSLVDYLRTGEPGEAAPPAVLLSYGRLNSFRESFAHEMNTMRKDLADADAVFDSLRKVEVTPWCPAEVADRPVIREFVRSLYLSGNGAAIFGNSFVEWAASEALRRARPTFLAAQFGIRNKPKPFTGVVLFENPEKLNPLPPVPDLPGSAVDAQMLSLYVWLAAARYEEYHRSTACVCLAESLSQAYVVAPREFPLGHETAPVTLDRLAEGLRAWMA
jgi:hypothetical protein